MLNWKALSTTCQIEKCMIVLGDFNANIENRQDDKHKRKIR